MTTLAMPVAAPVTGYVTSPANSRRRGGSPATTTSARRIAIIAVREAGDDQAEVLAYDPAFLGSLRQAQRHAEVLAKALATKNCAAVDVQVIDQDNNQLLYSAQATPDLGPVAESLIAGRDQVRRTVLRGIAAGLTEREMVLLLCGGDS